VEVPAARLAPSGHHQLSGRYRDDMKKSGVVIPSLLLEVEAITEADDEIQLMVDRYEGHAPHPKACRILRDGVSSRIDRDWQSQE
jgi:hypothetical protein